MLALENAYPEAAEGGSLKVGPCWEGGAFNSNDVADNARVLYLNIQKYSSDHFNDHNHKTVKDGKIIDIWGGTYVYRPYTVYPWEENITGAHSDTPPNPDSYQLWSYGYDRRNNVLNTQATGDDICNWK